MNKHYRRQTKGGNSYEHNVLMMIVLYRANSYFYTLGIFYRPDFFTYCFLTQVSTLHTSDSDALRPISSLLSVFVRYNFKLYGIIYIY